MFSLSLSLTFLSQVNNAGAVEKVLRLHDVTNARAWFLDMDGESFVGELTSINGTVASKSKVGGGLMSSKAVNIADAAGNRCFTLSAHIKDKGIEIKDDSKNAVCAVLDRNFEFRILNEKFLKPEGLEDEKKAKFGEEEVEEKKIICRVAPDILKHPRAMPLHFLHLLEVTSRSATPTSPASSAAKELLRLSGREATLDGDANPSFLMACVCACYEMFQYLEKHKGGKHSEEAASAAMKGSHLKSSYFTVDSH